MVSFESDGKKVSPKISKISMLISAILMGNVGLLVTALERYSTFTLVLLRGIFGTIFLTLFMLKSRSFSKEFFKESFKLHWKWLLVVGLLNPVVIVLYFMNIVISGYAIAAFLLYTNGIFVLVFLIVFKIEKVSRINIVSFILALIGVAIIMEFWNGLEPSLGVILGILSGLALAILIFSKKMIYMERDKDTNNLNAIGNFDTFMAWWPTLFLILLFLPLGGAELVNLTIIDLIFALILGLLPTALAFTLYNVGVKNDKGGNIIILAYLEPVMATINNVIFLNELSIFVIIGGTLILLANIVVLKYSK
jgi:drug/metabolite transporter (DMT)-like permease